MTRLITAGLGNPFSIGLTVTAIAAWLVLNLAIEVRGGHPIDPPPFQWLELVVSICALLVVFVVLATQRRDDELARLNQRLTLQLAIVAEQKAAKTIELLQQLRKDHPSIPDHKDDEATAMAQPTNPHDVVRAIKSERS
jgi:uncharacterized membrane protein